MSHILFVSENIGGHTTMHRHIKAALANHHPEIDATFIEADHRGPLRRIAGATVPGLARADVDFAPLRGQLAASVHLHRRVQRVRSRVDGLHIYTHHAAIARAEELGRVPSVVSLDATGVQTCRLLPYRQPTRLTKFSSAPSQRLERRVYDHAAAVVAKSMWAATSLIEHYGVPRERVHVIPYGITMPASPPAASERARRDPAIVFVGRSMERKGGWRLLSMWRRHLRRDCRLILVTPEHIPPEPGLEVIPTLEPGDDAMFSVLSEAAVMAFPSEMDTFGYAAIEAMAVGVPVVAFRTGATPEVVLDGVTGTLVEGGNDEAFAGALRGLLEADDARRRMAEAAQRWARRRFDATVTTAALVAVLDSVGVSARPELSA